ncbi:hypothetical protein IF2G_08974 [Cordyceps javanica]|nr:hypothetical protein IF2G_08974 [Cordyceps javanica]
MYSVISEYLLLLTRSQRKSSQPTSLSPCTRPDAQPEPGLSGNGHGLDCIVVRILHRFSFCADPVPLFYFHSFYQYPPLFSYPTTFFLLNLL